MKLYILTILLVVPLQLSAQQDARIKALESDFNVYSQHIKNNNYEEAVKYIYPVMIEMFGGKDALLSIIQEGGLEEEEEDYEDYEDDEYILSEHKEIIMPQKVYPAGNELHALITEMTVTKMEGGTSKYPQYTVAVSKDGGKSWTFFSPAALDPKKIVPAWNDELIIPEEEEIWISN